MVVATMLVLIAYKTPQDEDRTHRDTQLTYIPVIGMIGEDTLIPKNADRSRKTVGDGVWVIKSVSVHSFEYHHALPQEAIRLTATADVTGCGIYFDSDGMLKLIPREVMQTVERL